jgi:hypothetical protein
MPSDLRSPRTPSSLSCRMKHCQGIHHVLQVDVSETYKGEDEVEHVVEELANSAKDLGNGLVKSTEELLEDRADEGETLGLLLNAVDGLQDGRDQL